MIRIIRVIIQNYLHQKKNREEVKNREIRYLPGHSIFNLLSVYVLLRRILNHNPNYPTHHLYFGEVETPYYIPFNILREHKLYFCLAHCTDEDQKSETIVCS